MSKLANHIASVLCSYDKGRTIRYLREGLGNFSVHELFVDGGGRGIIFFSIVVKHNFNVLE
jgi:hypothetical protein